MDQAGAPVNENPAMARIDDTVPIVPELPGRPPARRRSDRIALARLALLEAHGKRIERSPSPAETRILLLEGVNDSAVQLFAQAGYTNVKRLPKALEGAELGEAIADIHLLGIRSRSQIGAEMLAAAPSLMALGCFSVGTNQVDLGAARDHGVPVFNAPFSNTRSVAELVVGEIIMLFRRVFPRSQAAHEGGWDKSATASREVRGKTLGLVGYGNIGSQVSTLAEAIGMRVIYFDLADKLRHGNTEPVASLQELLTQADVVSLHVPETRATYQMIGERELAAMRRGAYLINNSRGHVVDLEALAAALKSGHLAGAAVDVFPQEPESNTERLKTPLQGIGNVILTPHIGGSTEEAQERIGTEVARKMLDYVETGSTMGAVNFPQAQLPGRPAGGRLLHIHRNIPGMMRRLSEVFLQLDINIAAQYLQTDNEIGYVVLDAEAAGERLNDLLDELQSLDGTIRARLVY
jgi:D-3-phosphoglycerate dehydrogenase